MTDAKAIAGWTGWCDPCGTTRPLSLTEAGPRGLRAWLRGVSWEDRELGLYCRVCGRHQVVPLHEEDDPAVVVTRAGLLTATAPVGASAVAVARPARVLVVDVAAGSATPPRPVVPPQRVATSHEASADLPASETTLDLVAEGFAIA